MKAAIYARVSTAKVEQEHGLEAQRRACLELARSKGLWEDGVDIYTDQISGRRAERPGLDRLLHDVAMKRVRALVVFRLDRLSRGGIPEMFRVIKALEGYGCRVYSVSEAWWDPDNPAHELILAVVAWAAAFESKVIGDRVAAGIRARRAEAAEKGERFLWGRARSSKLTADPSLPFRALQLRSQGLSWSSVAKELHVGRTTARELCVIARAQNRGDPRGQEVADGGPTD